MFEEALKGASQGLTIYGIWTTGEWLFHEDGWAWEHIGRELVERVNRGQLNLSLSLVLAKNPLGDTERLRRGAEVIKRLTQLANLNPGGPASLEAPPFVQIDWHKQNRVLTMLEWIDRASTTHRRGIYMRRRLATPLVAPVSVAGTDCQVLIDVLQQYRTKAESPGV